MASVKIGSVNALREYGRYLGIKGLWGKNKATLSEHIFDKVHEAVNERMLRKPNLDPERAYMEASLAMRSKKITVNKTWATLREQANNSQIAVNRKHTKDQVERLLTERKRDGLEDQYHKMRVKNSTIKSIREYPEIIARMEQIEDGDRVKKFEITGNLNSVSTKLIMDKITPSVEMRTKVVYSFACEIHRGAGDIVDYHKTLSGEGMFTSMKEIRDYIENCEQKRLDLENGEVWSKAYLPATRTIESRGAYQGRVVFKHVRIKLISSNEPLMGCGPLPEWLGSKRCIYKIDTFDDNLCVWRCLAIHNRITVGRKRPEEDTNRDALKLARDYYKQPALRTENVRATKLVDFEGIARNYNINIRLYEPKNNSKTVWRLVYGKNQHKEGLPDVNIGLYQGHCFYIKNLNLLAKCWECTACKQRFNKNCNYRRHEKTCSGGKTKVVCAGKKFQRIMNSTEKVFYGGSQNYSYSACQWIEKQSEKIGHHIHHALCCHGGERQVTVLIENDKGELEPYLYSVDGYEPETNTVYQYHGCYWHGCTCQKDRTKKQFARYVDTICLDKHIERNNYNLVVVWECENPEKSNKWFEKKFIPYPDYIVFDFEARFEVTNEERTSDLTYKSRHIQLSVGISDSFTNKAVYCVDADPKKLVQKFMGVLQDKWLTITENVKAKLPFPVDFDMLPIKVRDEWNSWYNQVPVFGFNSGSYDIPLIKEYFVKILSDNTKEHVFVAKKENNYMFLTTEKFKFLDIKNYLAPGLSYDGWCKAYGCNLQKLVFPYEWLDSFERLEHVGPVSYDAFYSTLKGENMLTRDEYQNFCVEFDRRGCVTMGDWLREYNIADVEPFIEALDKTRKQYYPDEIDILKDAVSIPAISMTYVLNKALKMRAKNDPELYAPGGGCTHKCDNECIKSRCNKCLKIQTRCKECKPNAAYELLKTGMVGGPSIVFCRYAEQGVTYIRSHVYGKESKKCKGIIGYDANALYLYCSGQKMPCGKEKLVVNERPTSINRIQKFVKDVLNDKVFGYVQVDINVPEKLWGKFSEMSPFFVVQEIPESCIPEHMKKYQLDTGRTTVKGTKKLLGVMKAAKILLYTPFLKWCLGRGCEITAEYQLVEYEPGTPFAWFPEEVADARRGGDIEALKESLVKALNDKTEISGVLKKLKSYPDLADFVKDNDLDQLLSHLHKHYTGKKGLGDTSKLKGNSFYGKLIEDLERHTNTRFTSKESDVDTALRSAFFEDLEEIDGAYEIRERKRQIQIKRPYQCGIAVYQLAKLRMLEFYYDFLDKYVDRCDFELMYMDTDSFYIALSAETLDDVIKPELRAEYEAEKSKWLATDKYSERTPGLFKIEFIGFRMIALTAKCYFVEGKEGTKYSCKGVSKKQNEMTWNRYMEALNGSIDKAKNIGFRVHDQGIVTYEQNKLGLSAYYDKRYVLEDGIHTEPLKLAPAIAT